MIAVTIVLNTYLQSVMTKIISVSHVQSVILCYTKLIILDAIIVVTPVYKAHMKKMVITIFVQQSVQ